MYLAYVLLGLFAFTSASSVSKSECPELIETATPDNLKEVFLGVWYDVYIWLNLGKTRAECFSFEVLEADPEEVEAVREQCEGSGVNFDWDNAGMKIVAIYPPENPEPFRLISNVAGETEVYILQSCSLVSQLEIRQVTGSDDVMVAASEYAAELLTRQPPEQDQLDCLVRGIDVTQDFTWGMETCTRGVVPKNDRDISAKKHGFGY